jgi:Rrf2 family protein
MISQTAEYALRIVVYLAAQDGKPVVTRDIALGTLIPEGYLAKVLQQLARAGVVRSQRGLHGGFALATDPEQLTVYDVLQVVDPIRRITACPLGLPAHSNTLCPLHRRLDDAAQLVERAFRQSSIAQLLREPATSTPLCDTSRPRARDRARRVPLTLSRPRKTGAYE